MNEHSPLSVKGSLFERATKIYDFDAALRGRAAPAVEAPLEEMAPALEVAPELVAPAAGADHALDADRRRRTVR